MSDGIDPATLARLIQRAVGKTAPNLTNGLSPRLVAAETVCACALHLVMQWGAWESLNRSALAAIGTETGQLAADALVAYELLDQAVHMWAPDSHPAVSGLARSSLAASAANER